MINFPHHYKISGTALQDGDVSLSGEGLAAIASAPPIEFGGPGDKWSPESLLVAAIADCFILSFRAIARASQFQWKSLECDVTGILDRVEKTTKFTRFDIKAVLYLDPGAKQDMAIRLLEKAEKSCLITNSLSGETHLVVEVNEA